ncbi:MAG: hypothetical protein ACLSBB_11030 [Ruthenibacterium lactatiformans]
MCGGKRTNAFVEPTVLEVSPETDIARDMEVSALFSMIVLIPYRRP